MKREPIVGFEWDEANRAKCQKHGVGLEEIEAVFEHPHKLAPDLAHSNVETRFLVIGNGGGPRPIFVAFTLRDGPDGQLIRPISARYMHRKEIAHYEQAAPKTDH